jgi:hypothetical protein
MDTDRFNHGDCEEFWLFPFHASLLRLRCDHLKIFTSSGALPQKSHDARPFRSLIEAPAALELMSGVLLAPE